jgi:hypothetical protein
MKPSKPLFILPYAPGAVKLTLEQAQLLFTDQEIAQGKQQGALNTVGEWQLPVSYVALCCSNTFNRDTFPVEHGPLHVFGKRTLSKVKQSGYQLEGRVKVNGTERRGFTSSQLFELPGGRLIDAAIIHAVGAAQ